MQFTPLRRVALFLALAYGFAWPLEFGFFALGGTVNSPAFVGIAVLCMFTPALAAVIAQKIIGKVSWRDLGLTKPRVRWLLIAWLGPLLLVVLALAVSLLIPGVSLATGLDGFLAALADKLPAPQIAETRRHLEHTILARPGVLLLVIIAQVLVAGPTVNAGVALGEELGWRGFLFTELNPLGFWRSSFLIGFFWGLWHLPVIVNGYNYPRHPVVGPIMMTVLTILLSPLMGYVRLRAESVFAPAVFHGTFNAAAGLVIFLKGETALLTGMTGLAGMLVLLLADGALWLYLRRNPVRVESADRVRE
jgi:uncharacterized protein